MKANIESHEFSIFYPFHSAMQPATRAINLICLHLASPLNIWQHLSSKVTTYPEPLACTPSWLLLSLLQTALSGIGGWILYHPSDSSENNIWNIESKNFLSCFLAHRILLKCLNLFTQCQWMLILLTPSVHQPTCCIQIHHTSTWH